MGGCGCDVKAVDTLLVNVSVYFVQNLVIQGGAPLLRVGGVAQPPVLPLLVPAVELDTQVHPNIRNHGEGPY